MTLVFPRAMPATGVGTQIFEPAQVSYLSPTNGGAAYGVTAGLKRWRAEYTLAQALTQAQSDDWSAFLDSLDGSNRTFFAYDVARLYPLLYPNGFGGLGRAGGGAFDGSLTAWSQTITADGQAEARLEGLPAGFELSTRDYVDFRWQTSGIERRHLVRALEPATADGTGVIAAVAVSPPIHATVVPGTAVAHLDNPAMVARIDVSQTKVTAMNRRARIGATIVAIQDLRQ